MTLEELNLACDRLEAAQACRNLVGKLSYYSTTFRTRELLELWDHSEEAALELPEGKWQGYDQLAAGLMETRGDRNDPGMDVKLKGTLLIHNVNSDLLEINETCDSAEGVWYSPGLETDLYDPTAPDSPVNKANTAGLEASANYVWQVYRMTFVKVDGSWKIRSLKVSTIFDTPFDTPWTQCENTLWAADRTPPIL